jgi:hypothetical protein
MCGMRVGRVVAINGKSRPMVDFPGNPGGSLEARCIEGAMGLPVDGIETDTAVLLAFDGGDPALPVIIGRIRETIEQCENRSAPELQQRSTRELIVEGKSMIVRADQEITLSCGKSSITLQKDGKIVIRAAEIVSRASRTNKIRGATVMIN